MHMNQLLLSFGLAGSIAPAAAFFRMSCPGRLTRQRLDPVVNPGAVSGHVHNIAGGAAFGPAMTFRQARASKCSSCEIKEDMSNYWTPQLYVKKLDGSISPVPVVGDPQDINGGSTVYYLQRGASGEKLYAYPEGFRMLAGDTTKRNFTGGLDAKGVSFNCLGANQPETNGIPNYNCPGGLRAQIFFPQCWNGKDLDPPDHKSHMSYPAGTEYNGGSCPPDYPVHMIALFYEILYDTNLFADQWVNGQHPFIFSNGDPTGYGYHGDFVNGWNVEALQNAVDGCLDPSGLTSKCQAITRFTAEESNACKLPDVVDEQTGGNLTALPGCNPINSGPAPAKGVAGCPVPAIIAPKPNYVDLTQSKQWEYVGCGIDNIGDRSFTGASTGSDNMTVESCVDFCSSGGFSYAGLEYGRECWCANQLDPDTAPVDGILGACLMPCAGDSSELCGNAGAMGIYHKCSSSSCSNYNLVVGGGSTTAIGTTASTTPTPTAPPRCPRNNCVNQIFNPTASVPAQTFCASYTTTVNSAPSAIPSYLNACGGDSGFVSSACSCLMYYPTGVPKARRDILN